MRRRFSCAILAVACLVQVGDVLAFKLLPHATSAENRVRYLEASRLDTLFDSMASWVSDQFTVPVHEEITHRIWGCDGKVAKDCLAPMPNGRFAPPALLFGVQWNDNPPFALTSTNTDSCPVEVTIRLPNYSKCWVTLFSDASKRAARGEHFDHRSNVALLYRVHFGDMQFLHSMASWDGELMRDTKARILTWAEFAYRTATGDIDPGTAVSNTPLTGISRLFKGKGYSVQTLFTRGTPEYQHKVPEVALGSLLHMVEDSFAKGHVAREEAPGAPCPANPAAQKAGRVVAFRSFTNQDQRKHGEKDSRNALEAGLVSSPDWNVVTVGRALKAMHAARKPWAEVRAYLDQCVFEVDDDDLDIAAGPGQEFEKN